MSIINGISPRSVLIALSLIGFSTILSADTITFTLGGNPSQMYMGVNVGPYPGTLTGTDLTEFFCLDFQQTSSFGGSYTGTTSAPSGQAEDEVAFLTSYLLSQGNPSSDPNFVNQFEGPISFAIWQITGTLGSTPPDPAAQYFVGLAEDAYNMGLITPAFLANFLVFTPTDSSIQSFITAFPDDAIVEEVVPEPRTVVLLFSGFLVLFVGRTWWQRSRQLKA